MYLAEQKRFENVLIYTICLIALSCFKYDRININGQFSYVVKDISNYTIVAGKHYSNIHRKKNAAQFRKVSFVEMRIYFYGLYFTVNNY